MTALAGEYVAPFNLSYITHLTTLPNSQNGERTNSFTETRRESTCFIEMSTKAHGFTKPTTLSVRKFVEKCKLLKNFEQWSFWWILRNDFINEFGLAAGKWRERSKSWELAEKFLLQLYQPSNTNFSKTCFRLFTHSTAKQKCSVMARWWGNFFLFH